MRASLRCAVLGAVNLAAWIGCGCKILDDPSGPTVSQMSHVAGRLATAAMHSMGAAPVARPGPALAPGTSYPVNISASYRVNCTAGGSIIVTGHLTGSINDQGTGLLTIGETETVTAWQCDPPGVWDGDPYVTLTGTIPMQSGNLSPLGAQFSIAGTLRWSGSGSGHCSIYLSIIIQANGSGHTTGTICGHQLDMYT